MDLTTPSSSPTISKRCSEVKNLLEGLLAAVGKEPRDGFSITKDDISDQLDRFLLWAGNLGALRNPKSKLSLDQRLSSAPEVREQILRQFADIEEAVDDLRAILYRERPNRQIASTPSSLSGSDDDDDELESPDDELDGGDEAHMTLEVISQSNKTLFRIAIIVRKSGTRDRFSKALQMSTTSFSVVHDIDYVRHRHPKLLQNGRSESVVGRLGSAISKRRQFITYCRDHNARLAANDELQAYAPTELISSKATTFQPLNRDMASLGLGDAVEYDENDDDVDDAMSTMTASTATDALSILKLPRLADLSPNDEPFKCPICSALTSFKSEKAWRLHAFSDLKAYVCTADDKTCDDLLFGDRNSWFKHELECHRAHYICVLCDSDPLASAARLRAHIRDTHTFVTSDQVPKLEEAGRRVPNNFTADECPFCDEWVETLTAKHAAVAHLNPDEERCRVVNVTASRFKRHVAMHQEQMAIFAMPRAVGEDDRSELGSVAGSLSSRAADLSEVEDELQFEDFIPEDSDEELDAEDPEQIDVGMTAHREQQAAVSPGLGKQEPQSLASPSSRNPIAEHISDVESGYADSETDYEDESSRPRSSVEGHDRDHGQAAQLDDLQRDSDEQSRSLHDNDVHTHEMKETDSALGERVSAAEHLNSAPSTDQTESLPSLEAMSAALRGQISRRSPEPLLLDDLEDTFRDALEKTHAELCLRIKEHPDSYIMTREEFVILDYFNSHSMTDEVAENARKRYDNNGGTQTKPAFEDAKDYVENAKNRLQTLPGAYNTLLDILNGFDSKELDIPEVMRRVSHLFIEHSDLIEGFNAFLPSGHHLDYIPGQEGLGSVLLTFLLDDGTTSTAIVKQIAEV